MEAFSSCSSSSEINDTILEVVKEDTKSSSSSHLSKLEPEKQ